MTNLCQSVFACKASVTLIKKNTVISEFKGSYFYATPYYSLLVAPLFFSFLEFSVRK